jgi:hypothetical protein
MKNGEWRMAGGLDCAMGIIVITTPIDDSKDGAPWITTIRVIASIP